MERRGKKEAIEDSIDDASLSGVPWNEWWTLWVMDPNG